MKAYSDNKTAYISDLIKQKHKKEEFSCLYAMYCVSTTERQ